MLNGQLRQSSLLFAPVCLYSFEICRCRIQCYAISNRRPREMHDLVTPVADFVENYFHKFVGDIIARCPSSSAFWPDSFRPTTPQSIAYPLLSAVCKLPSRDRTSSVSLTSAQSSYWSSLEFGPEACSSKTSSMRWQSPISI